MTGAAAGAVSQSGYSRERQLPASAAPSSQGARGFWASLSSGWEAFSATSQQSAAASAWQDVSSPERAKYNYKKAIASESVCRWGARGRVEHGRARGIAAHRSGRM